MMAASVSGPWSEIDFSILYVHSPSQHLSRALC
ncbi:mCG119960 [Mus musculus]|nr:mCG119960 [Mus musculus]